MFQKCCSRITYASVESSDMMLSLSFCMHAFDGVEQACIVNIKCCHGLHIVGHIVRCSCDSQY